MNEDDDMKTKITLFTESFECYFERNIYNSRFGDIDNNGQILNGFLSSRSGGWCPQADFETGIDIKSRSSVDACILWNPIQAQIQEGLVTIGFGYCFSKRWMRSKAVLSSWGRTVNMIAFVHFQQERTSSSVEVMWWKQRNPLVTCCCS